MLQLSSDPSFHFELLRTLAHARYFGADVGEVLEAASRIEAGNFESFAKVFESLANRVYEQAQQIDKTTRPVSARDAYFRAATYFRAADFYLHGNPEDSRINDFWQKQTIAFDRAIALLPNPGERITWKADGFDVPAIFFRTGVADASNPRPTLIMGNGYDGAQEEMLHSCGFAALERGYNVVTYEGPGQPTVLRNQGLGFITQWEKVVSPVVDYLRTREDVDSAKIGLIGFSMGGFLALRAAAFEGRLAAAIAIDGIFDVHGAYMSMLPPPWKSANGEEVDAMVTNLLQSGKAPTGLRWGVEQGLWSFKTSSPADFLDRTKTMTLEGISGGIQCPVWVGCAGDDEFFQGQPEMVRDALGARATYVKLTMDDGAGHHCHVGAGVLMNQRVFDWFGDVVAKK